jgi:pimeloyl-ACP methyl ester carboxylesterase
MSTQTADPFEPLDRAHAKSIAALAAKGADCLRHPGGTLGAHLLRTAKRLESWGASRALTLAGLQHAAYGTQGYPQPLYAVAERSVLRDEIGDEAEAIVYAYCARDRAAATHELRDRFSGEYWMASAWMKRQLAELTVANELDVVEHTELSHDALTAIAELINAAGPWLSQAAWSSVLSTSSLAEHVSLTAAPSGDVALSYRDLGSRGEHVLLWHGGGGAELTWSRQHSLCAKFQLRIPWLRGAVPSVPAARVDWTIDVRDLLRVMPARAHVVAHSYGGVSALVAASIAPERFGSLTIIEAPLWALAPHDAELQQLAALGRDFANGAPEARDAFLVLAALASGHPQTARLERYARDFRDPGEAKPELERVRACGLRIAIVSGDHNAAIERMSDGLARDLGAERWVLAGAAHAVPRQRDFNARLSDFILRTTCR